jgi:predicted nucleic acid-binding protein
MAGQARCSPICTCSSGTSSPKVTNVLYRYQRQGWMKEETVEAALRAALELPIELVNDPTLHLRARALAYQLRLPAAYDAHYLALAERLDASLWTIDEHFYNTVKAAKITRIRLLE